MTKSTIASHLRAIHATPVLCLVFSSRRQPLNGFYLGSFLFRCTSPLPFCCFNPDVCQARQWRIFSGIFPAMFKPDNPFNVHFNKPAISFYLIIPYVFCTPCVENTFLVM